MKCMLSFILSIIITTVCYSQTAEEFIEMGSYQLRIDDWRGAIWNYNKAIEINPRNANYYESRAAAEFFGEDFKSAISDYSKAIELNPKIDSYYTGRAKAKSMINDYYGAISDFSSALELEYIQDVCYYQRGIAKLAVKQNESGCLDLSKAGERGVKNAYVLINKYCN